MTKKERRKCRKLDKAHGLAKGSTEWLKNAIMKSAKSKGLKNA